MKVFVEQSNSPASSLLAHIGAALNNVAPEKAEELEERLRGVHLKVLGSDAWVCCIDPGTGEVQISTKTIEILWCASYAYFVVYVRIAAGKMATMGGDVTIDLTHDPETKNAASLLSWAIEEMTHGGTSKQWPADLPRPSANAAKGSNESVADELALCAVAFLLHHEVAHWKLKHRAVLSPQVKPPKRNAGKVLDTDADSVQQEREADYEAASWILSNIDPADNRFIKRALGVAAAFLPRVGVAIHVGKHGGKTHPRPYDRVLHTFDRFIGDDPWHVVWAFLVAAMKLHLDNTTMLPPPCSAVFPNFRSAVDAYADRLAESQALK